MTAADRHQAAAERSRAVAVPADRGLRVPLELPYRRADRAGRRGRLALRSRLRVAERVRQPARPRGRLLQVRPVRDHASDRAHYEPGTNVLVTTWKTPSGWIVVRDALTMGPTESRGRRSRRTRGRRPTTTPTTCSCAPSNASAGASRSSSSASRRSTTAATPAEWSLVDGGRHAADATGAGQAIRLVSDLALGIEGNRVRARHVLETGDRAYCALSWAEELRGARRTPTRPSARIDATVRFWRNWLGRGAHPRPPLARPDPALGARDQGADVHADRRDRRRATTSLPETPGGERNWDYRYTWMRDTTFTLQALHWLNLDWEADEFMQFIADLEPNEDGSLQIMYGIDGRRDLTESTRDDLSGYAGARPVRLGNGAFDQRQNDVFGAVLDSILLHTSKSERLPRRLWPIVAVAGRVRDQGLARAGPGHLGGARQAAALRLLEADVLGRARPRRAARGDPRRPGAAGRSGARPPRRSGPTSSRTASASRASCASTTRRTRSTPRRCSRRCSGSCPATTSGCARP